jgi:lysophospholipase L1-like esterase
MPQDRRGHVLRDALVVVATTALLLLALEGGARLLGVGAPDLPELEPKRPGTFRILALGGSTTLGVPDGAFGFVTQLGDALTRLAPGRDVEILNLARAGAPSAYARDVLAASQGAEPDLVLLLTGHNELIAPRATHSWRDALQRLRDASFLARAVSGALSAEVEEPAIPDALTPVDPQTLAAASEGFRDNLDAIVALARRLDVPLLLCTAPSNLAEWPPAHRHVAWQPPRPELASFVDALEARLAGDAPEEALRLADAWLARNPGDAIVHFLAGRALRASGRPAQALERFQRARDLDPVPRRAFGSFNQELRDRGKRPGVLLADVAHRFGEYAQEGLVGFELVCDNCHPTPLGNALIAREIAATLAAAGVLVPASADLGEVEDWLERAERRIGGPEQRRRVRVRWLLSNAIYAMKTPFFNYEASRRYLEQAQALAPGDWRVAANLATLDLLEGHLVNGRRALLRATRLKGAPLDPSDRALTPYLAEALARSDTSLPAAGGS